MPLVVDLAQICTLAQIHNAATSLGFLHKFKDLNSVSGASMARSQQVRPRL